MWRTWRVSGCTSGGRPPVAIHCEFLSANQSYLRHITSVHVWRRLAGGCAAHRSRLRRPGPRTPAQMHHMMVWPNRHSVEGGDLQGYLCRTGKPQWTCTPCKTGLHITVHGTHGSHSYLSGCGHVQLQLPCRLQSCFTPLIMMCLACCN